MMTVITGGSGSGKSAYAEKYTVQLSALSGECRRYYLATMQVFDSEGQKKVERHRKQRSKLQFQTIEQPVEIQQALEQITPPGCVLLECISNLTANEMFAGEVPAAAEAVVEKVVSGIRKLKEHTTHLVIVTNNVFEDGILYEETTMAYIRAMGMINQRMAELADEVIEVVVGIPVVMKKCERREIR